MDVTFQFFSIEPTTIIGVLINTFILLLLFKKFLFEPVNKIVEQRKGEVAKTYEDADKTLESAHALQEEYTEKLSMAKEESARIIKTATERAQIRSDEIVAGAKTEAENIITRANNEIERERSRAVNEVKGEISDIAVELAGKIIGREVEKDGTQEKLINDFIDNL